MPSETLNSHFKTSASPLNSSKPPYEPPPPPHPDPPTASQSMLPTTAKSSNWLHRLRASRGFPDSDHIDLEHFLSTSREKTDSTDSSLAGTKPLLDENSVAGKCDDDNGAVQGRDLVNNVLSDLFYMGECEDQSRIKRKKSCRKQSCPKICDVLSNLGVEKITVRKDRLTSPLTLSIRHKAKEVNQVTEIVEEEEEKAPWDLSAYSQTEVTVIDTSIPCWKFDKVLYRSKNVWKVGDRKGKGLMSGDRKKRKGRLNETGGDAPKKKLKKKLKLCNSSKYADKGDTMVLSKCDQGHDRGKSVAGYEKKRDNCSQVQGKSSGKKQVDEGSSVILIKSIPTTNKKNVSRVSNSCVKSMPR